MVRISPEFFGFSILFTLLIAVLLGMLWAWAWAMGRMWKGLPVLVSEHSGPCRPAPWGSFTVLLLVLLYLGVNIFVSRVYAAATGRSLPRAAMAAEKSDGGEPIKKKEQTRTPDQPGGPGRAAVEASSKDVKSAPVGPGPEARPEQSLAELMFQSALSNCLLLVLVPGFLRWTLGVKLAELGLHGKRLSRQVAIGFRAALLMTPPVCAIQFLAVQVWRSKTHPVEQMVLEQFTAGVAILAVVSTMVLAPLIEELLFRGIFQRWLDRMFDNRPEPETISQSGKEHALLQEPGPLEAENKQSVRDSEYDPPRSDPGSPGDEFMDDVRGPASSPQSHLSNLPILFTSIFFAAMHLPQWPAPLAIFLLSMALGIVYQRSGSLVAAITMHATFNGFNTLLLLLAALSRNIQVPIHPANWVIPALGVLADLVGGMGLK